MSVCHLPCPETLGIERVIFTHHHYTEHSIAKILQNIHTRQWILLQCLLRRISYISWNSGITLYFVGSNWLQTVLCWPVYELTGVNQFYHISYLFHRHNLQVFISDKNAICCCHYKVLETGLACALEPLRDKTFIHQRAEICWRRFPRIYDIRATISSQVCINLSINRQTLLQYTDWRELCRVRNGMPHGIEKISEAKQPKDLFFIITTQFHSLLIIETYINVYSKKIFKSLESYS